MLMRLDKFFSELGILSRSDCKKELKKKTVSVNGVIITKPETKIDPETDEICFHGERIVYEPFVYYMLHKPDGVVSATEDRDHKTVIDLLKEQFPEEGREIFPVGRLDIDTEGLLLLTNDGVLSHELLSPAKHVEKTYFVRVEGILSEKDLATLEQGMDIGDEKLTKPAKAQIVANGEESELFLTITEGRYHQVKRMLVGVGHPVVYLKRESFGPITLDPELACGQLRKLSGVEITMLKHGH